MKLTFSQYGDESTRARLEDCFRHQSFEFAKLVTRRACPQISTERVERICWDVYGELQTGSPSERSGVQLQLVYRHECQNLGCLDPKCILCENNPQRRCSLNFNAKYLVNDSLRAKCDAPIRIELVDLASGTVYTENIPGLSLKLSILDGNTFDSMGCDVTGNNVEQCINMCSLLANKKNQPLLVSGSSLANAPIAPISVPVKDGVAELPDLQVTDSSEAMLPGRKPPFRLLAEAVFDSSVEGYYQIIPAVSEGFVVATRRTRTAKKAEFPYEDDHVSKLEHMGRETVKKLSDLNASGRPLGITFDPPVGPVETVGQFRQLAWMTDIDLSLKNKVQQVLKLSKEKWNEAREHAMKAVVPDNRLRVWYPDSQELGHGILFSCRLGSIDLSKPVGVLNRSLIDGELKITATPTVSVPPAQQEKIRSHFPKLTASWWLPGHPGWAVYPADSEKFITQGVLQPSLTSSDMQVPLEQSMKSPPSHAGHESMNKKHTSHNGLPSNLQELASAFSNHGNSFQSDSRMEAPQRQSNHDKRCREHAARNNDIHYIEDGSTFQGFPHSPPFMVGEDMDILFSHHRENSIPLSRLSSWAFGRLASLDHKGLAPKVISNEDGSIPFCKIFEGLDRVPSGLEAMRSIEEALPDDILRSIQHK